MEQDDLDLHLPDTVEFDLDLVFDVGEFALLDEEEQTRIMRPKLAKSALFDTVAQREQRRQLQNLLMYRSVEHIV